MTGYDFFIAQLRFVAKRTERESDEVASMMDALERIAGDIEKNGDHFFVDKNDLRGAARALVGVAGFLQQHILPEVVAAKNDIGETQVRWTIEVCMSAMADLMTHAELTQDGEGLRVDLPKAP